jgi:hypothetical protein
MTDHEGFNDEQGTRRAIEPTGVQADAIAGQGRVRERPPAGTTPSHERASFSDPVSANIDPTAPESPEQNPARDQATAKEKERALRAGENLEPHQNLSDLKRDDERDEQRDEERS